MRLASEAAHPDYDALRALHLELLTYSGEALAGCNWFDTATGTAEVEGYRFCRACRRLNATPDRYVIHGEVAVYYREIGDRVRWSMDPEELADLLTDWPLTPDRPTASGVAYFDVDCQRMRLLPHPVWWAGCNSDPNRKCKT